MASQPVMAPHPAAPLAPPNAVALPDPTALSLGIAYCNSCKRPCSGKLALNHVRSFELALILKLDLTLQ